MKCEKGDISYSVMRVIKEKIAVICFEKQPCLFVAGKVLPLVLSTWLFSSAWKPASEAKQDCHHFLCFGCVFWLLCVMSSGPGETSECMSWIPSRLLSVVRSTLGVHLVHFNLKKLFKPNVIFNIKKKKKKVGNKWIYFLCHGIKQMFEQKIKTCLSQKVKFKATKIQALMSVFFPYDKWVLYFAKDR